MKTLLHFQGDTARLIYRSKGLYLIVVLILCLACRSQGQTVEWDKTIGGNDQDDLHAMQRTNDGGYILGGTSWSGKSGEKSEESKGNSDFWIVKLGADGTILWDKTFGGDSFEDLRAIQQTSDGGYLVGGYTYSPASGDKSEPNRGNCEDGFCSADYWVLKLDANGNLLWERTFGGDGNDELQALQQTTDGGFILGGYSDSGISGDKSEANKGSCDTADCQMDYWVIKLNGNGHKVWDKTFGSTGHDQLYSINQTSDEGYILGGVSSSDIGGDKSEASRGSNDFWVLKINKDGNKEWDRTYGGTADDALTAIQQTHDGGYLLGGNSFSGQDGDKSEASRGDHDIWVVKLDAAGHKEWDRTLGGDDYETLTSLLLTATGEIMLGGWSSSYKNGDKTTDSKGLTDYWLVKLDNKGTKLWDKVYGGAGGDHLYSMQQAMDGGFVLAGTSESGISGDKTGANRGLLGNENDFWIVKLSPEPACTPPTPSIALVPTSKVYTGSDPATLYLGYGPQSVRLQAHGADRYEWSPAAGLSSTTAANPVFSPTTAGTYTFTLTAFNGVCAAASTVTITVMDVRCGKGKVLVCHNGKPLCIAVAAVEAHLRNHKGDRLGNCTPASLTENDATVALRAYPNPFHDRTNVEFSLPEDGNYRLELYNANGKMLGTVAQGKGRSGQLIQQELAGRKLKEGIHYLRLFTKNEVQTVRLVLKK